MTEKQLVKIYKIIDGLEESEYKPFFEAIKSYVNGKMIAKSQEYQELAEKFQSLSESVK